MSLVPNQKKTKKGIIPSLKCTECGGFSPTPEEEHDITVLKCPFIDRNIEKRVNTMRDPSTLEYIEKQADVFTDALEKESDRALGIIAVCWFDNLLEKLLRASFVKDPQVKTLFKNDHILQTFFAKTSICYFSGLIPKYIYHDLKLLGEIRNRFAHQVVSYITFDDEAITDRINRCELRPRTMESYPNRFKFMLIATQIGGVLAFHEHVLSKSELPKLLDVTKSDRPCYQNMTLTKEDVAKVISQAKQLAEDSNGTV